MDLSFSRRRNGNSQLLRSAVPDLAALLSAAAARQASTPTARAHWRGTIGNPPPPIVNARIDFFAGVDRPHRSGAFSASFAVLPPALFSPCQPT